MLFNVFAAGLDLEYTIVGVLLEQVTLSDGTVWARFLNNRGEVGRVPTDRTDGNVELKGGYLFTVCPD